MASKVLRLAPKLPYCVPTVRERAARGCLVTMLKVPPGSPRPYRKADGPFSTSMRSMETMSGLFG